MGSAQTPLITPTNESGSLSESEWRLLNGIYISTSSPAGYGSIKNLVEESGLSRKKVLEYFKNSKTYTKYRTPVRKFKRLGVKSLGINHIWSLDLAFMEKLSSQNDNVKYLLIAVDVLSRFLHVQPMKGNKSASTAKQAFAKMLKHNSDMSPTKCWVDEGGEFEGVFRQFCEGEGISIYHTFTETKSSFAERYIRTLKSVVYKYLEERQTTRYIGQLQNFVNLINSRVNRMTKLAPQDVRTEHTEYLITLNKDQHDYMMSTNRSKPKFRIGQTVRVAYKREPFDKGYKQSFSTEVYKIVRISSQQRPITYVLQDVERRNILRRFYERELIIYRYNDSNKRAQHQRIIS